MGRHHWIFSFLIVISLAVIAYGFIREEKLAPPPPQAAVPFDSYMDNAEAIAYDAHGKVRWHARVKRWIFASEAHHTQLDHPNLTIFDANKHDAWHILSDRGEVDHEGSEVRPTLISLFDNVQLMQSLKNSPPLVIRSDIMHYQPIEQQVETDRHVDMAWSDGDMAGDGLKGDLKTGRILLLDRVNGQW